MIRSFGDKETEKVFNNQTSRKLPGNLRNVMVRKLKILNAAAALADLRVPPGNHLEALKADRVGQHSIRINQQWRICFVWTANGPAEVEIVDYH